MDPSSSSESSSSSSSGVLTSCSEALTEEECSAVVHGFDFEDCVWGDLYALEIVDAACEFTQLAGRGECMYVEEDDLSECDEDNACGGVAHRRVFYRPGEDSTTELVEVHGECYGAHPGPEWEQCVIPVEHDTSGGSSSGGATDTDIADPSVCDCGCSLEFPG